MGKISVLLSLVLATMSAVAQTTADATTASSTSATLGNPGVPPVVSSATAPDITEKGAKKWSSSLALESAMGMQAAKEGSAPVFTLGAIGVNYKASDKISVGVIQYFMNRTNLENLQGAETAYFAQGTPQVAGEQALTLTHRSAVTLLGSAPIAASYRFHLPTAYYLTQDGSNGIFRVDASPSWTLSPKISLDWRNSFRMNFYHAGPQGRDARWRIVTGPTVSYNFNDKISSYYTVLADQRTFKLNRGQIDNEALNYIAHDVGMNFTVGSVTINPSITTEPETASRDSSLFTEGSRVFAADTNSYNLNIYASF